MITGLERAFNKKTDFDLKEVSDDTLDVKKTNYEAKLVEENTNEIGST